MFEERPNTRERDRQRASTFICDALRSENGVEVTGSPSELRWPLVCVGVVVGPSLPRFMILW